MGMMKWFFLIVPLMAAKEQCSDSSIYTCKECLMRSRQCVWCADAPEVGDLKKQRIKCGTMTELITQKCNNILAKQSEMSDQVLGNQPEKESDSESNQSSTGRDLISPKSTTLRLRYGDPIEFKINFTSPQYYPIDMYYLMDLSQSMSDDLDNLRKLAKSLSTKMVEITGGIEGNFKIGHGSFVDKTVLPFVSTVPAKLKNPCSDHKPCEAPYTFRSNMRLSSNVTEFEEILSNTGHSSNLDAPEAGLDAMMQAIVCDDVIGWLPGRHKLLVYSSDANFHVAGDGKLGGILEPNNMECHTEKEGDKWTYTKANQYDYPSIGQIIDVINKKEILIIFAVTEDQVPTYEELQKLLPHATVGQLGKDSGNVIDIVVEKYKQLAQRVSLQYSNMPGVTTKVRARCNDVDSGNEEGICSGVQQNDQVQFSVELVWDELGGNGICPEDQIANFSIFGMDAWSKIKLEFICDCDCQPTKVPSLKWVNDDTQTSEKFTCNDGKYTTCGQCECPEDKVGNMCECDLKSEGDKDFFSKCTNPDAPEDKKLVCSGWGLCQCGLCICHKYGLGRTIYGKYCQCDTDVCQKGEGGYPCSGAEHGECNCNGSCTCNSGWKGDSCSCSTDDSKCINPADLQNGIIIPGTNPKACSGHGKCECGVCECYDFGEQLGSYSGDHCERFNSQCAKHEDCARCIFSAYHNVTSNILSPDCIDTCLSKDGKEIYIDGIEYDDVKHEAAILSAKVSSIIKDKVENVNKQNGKFCLGQDADGCQFNFAFHEISSSTNQRKIKLELEKERSCRPPANPWVVAGSILGGVVFLGLVILTLIKIIIYIISRREVKEWEKERNKTATTCGQNPLYKVPETKHDVSTVGYRAGYKVSSN